MWRVITGDVEGRKGALKEKGPRKVRFLFVFFENIFFGAGWRSRKSVGKNVFVIRRLEKGQEGGRREVVGGKTKRKEKEKSQTF